MRSPHHALPLAILFPTLIFALSATFAHPQGIAHRMPSPPASSQSSSDAAASAPNSGASAAKRAQLARNEKEFREGVERLYQLTNELRDEVRQTTTTKVLSIQMYKQTQEIENLAKQLKNKAKGS
jgi:hypothetical protein